MSDIDEIIRKRLDKLKGDIASFQKASTSGFLPTRTKTSAEQVDDLVAQLQSEISLRREERKSIRDVDSHIQDRLDKLKSREGCNFAPAASSSIPKDELVDEDFFNSSSCSDLLADLGDDSDKDSLSDNSSDSEELCIVCVKNKTTKVCFDCGDAYYCDTCYTIKHSDEQHDYTNYNISP